MLRAGNWAFYLGHHWGYLRELGEPQLTFNYVRALTDFIINFSFTKGVAFRSPKETAAITPYILQRVWEEDNKKQSLLWEMGQQGGVSGDCFVKIAYEEPWVNPVGYQHPGRCRIIPLNSSFCFPEWHPHDRDRMIRFKLKYRFWGTSLEGTRQVFTYTELLTDNAIEEYINDELISSNPNPLGEIPIVHICNLPASSSPWGLADVHDILVAQREYNEKATEISDIINYHSAPVTIITGAKAADLEKGSKKVWAGLPEKAKVQNLELTGDGLDGPLKWLETIKTYMHEMTGVPVTALGQEQAISNTSGVALSIQYIPLMMKWALKKQQYGEGIERINYYVLKTLALKEPQALVYDETRDVPLDDGQLTELDPADPLTYRTTTHWQSPLPIDKLIKLNELQAEMMAGLQSKLGALEELGYEFPKEKLQELMDEMVDDTKDQGALDWLKAEIYSAIEAVTGVSLLGDNVGGNQQQVASAGGPQVNSAPGDQQQQGQQPGAALPGTQTQGMKLEDPRKTLNDITTRALGTKLPQVRNPEKDNSD